MTADRTGGDRLRIDGDASAPVTLRPATLDDAAAVARLMGELGYATASDAMAARLRRLHADPMHTVVVADVDRTVVGLAGAYTVLGLELDGCYGRLTALVVDARFRGLGIGRMLIEHLEAWCRARGAARLIITSGNHRADAHRFYEAAGYVATGRRFVKAL